MAHQDQDHSGEDEARSAKHETPDERTVAPPIEREHETSAGVFEEEDEKGEHERQ